MADFTINCCTGRFVQIFDGVMVYSVASAIATKKSKKIMIITGSFKIRSL